MSQDILTEQNIFTIPAGDIWELPEEKVYILYAPLGGHISLATDETRDELLRCASGEDSPEAIKKALATFRATGSVPVHYLPKSPDELYQIDILCNYTCNFKCIYCYSAAGRSQGEVKFEDVKAVVDYLFKSGRKQTTPYIINFSGGGEPLLSFPLIQKTVEYIHEATEGTSYKYNIGLVTNGSLVTPEIVDYFIANKVDMAVSFEILPYLQNKERGSYEKVAANIDMMLAKGFPFGIRTTFTPESVDRMCEMIEEVHRRFPKLRKVVFDVVLAPSLFDSPEKLERYYDTFLTEYYKAKKLAAAYGITLESIAVETISMLRDRTCEGKIVLTPSGAISSCARVSSPREKLYDDYIYGEIKDNKVAFNQESFTSILNTHNIYTQKECEHCFAKWNCGGGCRLFHDSFEDSFKEARCNFVKKALKLELINILADRFERQTGKSLESHIKDCLKGNLQNR